MRSMQHKYQMVCTVVSSCVLLVHGVMQPVGHCRIPIVQVKEVVEAVDESKEVGESEFAKFEAQLSN